VWLTVTEPDRGPNDPVDLKRGHIYVLRNHLEVVEDLSFLQGRGRMGGPPNRKPRREFIWSYGVPDTEGERLPGRRGHNRGRDIRRQPRRDGDDDYDDRRTYGNRHHRSLSAWVRNPRCRGGVEDCISSNRWRGHMESPPRRSRVSNQVWKVREYKQENKHKKVSFADPIATELKAPKKIIPDDSIMLIKDPPHSVNQNITQFTTEDQMGGQDATNTIVTTPIFIPADPATDEGQQVGQHNKQARDLAADSIPNLDTVTTPSENAPNTEIDMQGAGAAHSVHNTLLVPTSAEAGKGREGLKVLQTTASKGQKLQLLFDHLNDFLVSSPLL
jgi:hypothetical protein